jgi:predicted ribosome quality control (RQC) complex YloA/Tae2 family protein
MAIENFRKFTLSTGKVITAGRNAEQNDLLVSTASRKDTLLHTNKPGSPFVNAGENPTYPEIEESAIYCAMRSQDFRDNHGDVKVNVFLKSDCRKGPMMKQGTWNVAKVRDTITVSKIEEE